MSKTPSDIIPSQDVTRSTMLDTIPEEETETEEDLEANEKDQSPPDLGQDGDQPAPPESPRLPSNPDRNQPQKGILKLRYLDSTNDSQLDKHGQETPADGKDSGHPTGLGSYPTDVEANQIRIRPLSPMTAASSVITQLRRKLAAATRQDADIPGQQSPFRSDSKQSVVKIFTDDTAVPTVIQTRQDLPLDRYTSLGIILDEEGQVKSPISVIRQTKSSLNSMAILTPVPPESNNTLRQNRDVQKYRAPMTFDSILDSHSSVFRPRPGQFPPPPHQGIVWPLAWATRPPFSSPGYNRLGAKQPVGTVQVARIPVKPSTAVINGAQVVLPTWVSPLYKSYGIGGPFGPHGPFYEPPFLEEPPVPPVEKKPERQLCWLSRRIRQWLKLREDKETSTDKLGLVEQHLSKIRQIVQEEQHKPETVSFVEKNLASLVKNAQDPTREPNPEDVKDTNDQTEANDVTVTKDVQNTNDVKETEDVVDAKDTQVKTNE